MGYCCGGSMIGGTGTLRHYRTYIHDVPILYCPVCNRIDIHPQIEDEYEILAEYAHSDQAPEVFFNDYVNDDVLDSLFENCTCFDDGDMEYLMKKQIDTSLDLLCLAKQMKDTLWEQDLKNRLSHLSQRLHKWQKQKSSL